MGRSTRAARTRGHEAPLLEGRAPLQNRKYNTCAKLDRRGKSLTGNHLPQLDRKSSQHLFSRTGATFTITLTGGQQSCTTLLPGAYPHPIAKALPARCRLAEPAQRAAPNGPRRSSCRRRSRSDKLIYKIIINLSMCLGYSRAADAPAAAGRHRTRSGSL